MYNIKQANITITNGQSLNTSIERVSVISINTLYVGGPGFHSRPGVRLVRGFF
jgi:hypothetical protein